MIQTLYNGIRFGLPGMDLDNVRKLDMGYLPLVHHMMKVGLQVDPTHFAKMEKTLVDDMEACTAKIRDLTGHWINPASGDQVADLLFNKLGIKQARKKMTASGKREAADDDVLTGIQHEHPCVSVIQYYREYDKLRGTYCIPLQKLAKRVNFTEWRIYPNLKTTRVPSGRNACADPNLLAMPNRTERGREMCQGFITRPGWVYLSVDFSQLEPRVVAHRSKDANLCRVYINEEDIYSDFATTAFKLDDQRYRDMSGWHYPTVDKKKQRFPAKTCILASIYEVTGAGLCEQMPVVCSGCGLEAEKHNCRKFTPMWNENNCQDLINAFYIKYSGIMDMRRRDHTLARYKAMVWDDWGRIHHVAAVRSALEWVVSGALREAGNFFIQCVNRNSTVFVQGEGRRAIGSLIGRNVSLWDGFEWSTGHVVASDTKPQLEIKLFDGLTIRCSPDHKILTSTNKGRQVWRRAGDLKSSNRNVRVCISHSIDEEWDWTGKCTDTLSGRDINTWSLEWYKSDPKLFGEMLGRIASDGCAIKKRGTPQVVYMLVAEHEKHILPTLMKAARLSCNHYKVSEVTKAGYNPLYRIEIYSKGLTSLLLQWGIKEHIPDFVWSNSEILRSYLRGMFDGDGGVTGLFSQVGGAVTLTFGANNGRLGLAKDIQMALLMLGIRSRLKTYQTSIRLTIQRSSMDAFMLHVGFMNFEKNMKGYEIKSQSKKIDLPTIGRAVAIKSIKELDPEPMVDFVDSSTGRFCSDGVIVHNSGGRGIVKLGETQAYDGFVGMGILGDQLNCVLDIHDELLMECREDMRAEIGAYVSDVFESTVKLDIPVKASQAWAVNWGSLPK